VPATNEAVVDNVILIDLLTAAAYMGAKLRCPRRSLGRRRVWRHSSLCNAASREFFLIGFEQAWRWQPMDPKILIVGTGDAAERVLMQMVQRNHLKNITICGRNAARGSDLTWSASGTAGRQLQFVNCDVSNQNSLGDALSKINPDVVINCASLSSPYFFGPRSDEASKNMVAAGFVSQLPMHIKLLTTLVRTAQSVSPRIKIVNLSAPELTGPVLKTQGLAPTIGIGNVGLLFKGVQVITSREAPGRQLRMFAHHSHIRAIRRNFDGTSIPKPVVYLDDERQQWTPYQAWMRNVPYGGSLSNLTAGLTCEIGEALSGATPAYKTSAPAPNGIAAGLPVTVSAGSVTLDLPLDFTLEQAIALNKEFARFDGIESIQDNGTVTFTDDAAAALARVDPELAKPLRFSDIEERSAIILALIKRLGG